jgi:alkylhydroperoxidase family enzyme
MDIQHAVGVKNGVPAEKLAAVATFRENALFTERERAALAFAEEIVRAQAPVSEQCFATVRRHFSERQVLELVFVVGYQVFASKFAHAFALPSQHFIVAQPL